MGVQTEDGKELSKDSLPLEEVEQAKVFEVQEDVYQTYDSPGSGTRNESQTRKLFYKGQHISQTDIDAAFPEDDDEEDENGNTKSKSRRTLSKKSKKSDSESSDA